MCVCAGGGGGYLLISVTEFKYRHDLVRLCRKFYFCPFQMKILHIDAKKELYALPIQGSVQDFLFWGLGGVDPKKIFGATQRRENFLGLVGVQGFVSVSVQDWLKSISGH